MNNKTCDECVYFEKFKPREDEISDMGCKANGWEGYIDDVNMPPCGKIAFRRREKK